MIGLDVTWVSIGKTGYVPDFAVRQTRTESDSGLRHEQTFRLALRMERRRDNAYKGSEAIDIEMDRSALERLQTLIETALAEQADAFEAYAAEEMKR